MRSSMILWPALLYSPLVASWSFSDSPAVLQIRDLILPHHNKRAPQIQTLGSSDAPSPNPSQDLNAPTSTLPPSDGSKSNDDNKDNKNASDGPSTLSNDVTQTSSDVSATDESSATTTGTNSGDSKKTSSSKSQTTKTFDPRLPAGGISMITPNPMSSASYYKIGQFVTFGWNLTSVSVTPSAIDILASCSTNQATYTIAVNQSVEASTGAVVWDTGKYQSTATIQLLTGTYTLIIYDADSSISATAAAGYLAPFKQFTFGMYTPQHYEALEGYQCVTCSGASALFERQTMRFAFGMAALTVASFTWFAHGAGMF